MPSFQYQDFVPAQRFQRALAFSPQGDHIAYSSNADGRSALWTVPAKGGSARKLAQLPGRIVRQAAWTPDGTGIVFTADHEGDEQFAIFRIGLDDDEPAPIATSPVCQRVLAPSPFDATGRRLVYGANDRDPAVQDVLVRDLATGETQRFEPEKNVMFTPIAWSPDSRWLLVAGGRSNTESASYLVDLGRPYAEPRCVTAAHGDGLFAPQAWAPDSSGFYLLTDLWGFTAAAFYTLADGELTPVARHDWDVEELDAACGTLAWTVNEAGRSVLHVRREDTVVRPDVPSGVISTLTLSPDGRTAAMLLDTPAHPEEIVVVDLDDATPRRLTDGRPSALHTVTPVRPESITYPTAGGREVHAFVYSPSTPGPHPVLLSIHGGPEGQERPRYAALYQHLLHHGVAVFAPNIAGSTGYGSAYQKLIYRDWGGIDLDDLDHAVRYLRARPDLDTDRIAVFGGSYGGFAALSCLARLPHGWAAGVSICGPSNLVTLASGAPPTWRNVIDVLLGDPERDAERLLANSPVTHADAINAPLMVLQGARAPRVPRAESDNLVERLRDRGVHVDYQVFPDEGHGFTTQANEIRAYSEAAAFLIKHLTAR
ncbi:alpha/beta hydrolase family protein [Actinomadura rupiterrae]|uniref:alpha/beta hydrolase family protein n=1 Tax=Actinomadura rupiterrae TaxID=559627 RepID=UPI0020A483E2|nr:S9 family peptidase [Actinomadura rupiterrae]MCP2341039.1 dipeptidyl aminopeptidase/acylaminoacyl peptidase [Actinomadura rupiterrae]